MTAVAENVGAQVDGAAIMKLARVEIENYRAIEQLHLSLDPSLTVFHDDNGHGKTSVLSAIATGLGSIEEQFSYVSSIDLLPSDRRGLRQLRVGLTAVDGMAWDRRWENSSTKTSYPDSNNLEKAMGAIVIADQEGTGPLTLPIVAFYDTDRAVFDLPQRRTGFRTEFSRYGALEGALSARTDFRDFFQWFYAKENEELREQKERLERLDSISTVDDLRAVRAARNYRFKDLEAIRKAIEAMVPGVTNPKIKHGPLRFVVSVQPDDGEPEEELSMDQLSGGYRIMLALAADLARRMAQGNPHLDDPLQSEAVVLRVNYETGEIGADAVACAEASIDVSSVEKTVQTLKLNVPRLKNARKQHWDDLSFNYQEYLNNSQKLEQAARMELLPGENNCLPRFFSTSRSYFGPVAEEIPEEAPQGLA